MLNAASRDAEAKERLSALVDGELDAADAAAACADWKQDAAMRASWHDYQLIGDTLRSDDLASTPARDAAFLCALRERLANEAVVLAPAPASPLSARRAPRRAWAAPSAVAACFAAVAGVLFINRNPPPAAPAVPLALARPAAPQRAEMPATQGASTAVLATAPSAPGQAMTLIRDPQLDRYLDAHQQFARRSALGMPSGYLRNAAVDVPGR